ncbi:hypothetical protein D1631_13465 [Chryseobacterium nematophagum]|uniref:Uncharacterized protein n=1 Tax=Chryseobacterium nematophagum TaxID=2305228 RepID=A0A3M7TIX0_9FLAO|nr:hypothetical protein [Chryseobacterium nematophagum]RNA62867.1 hypothetical protein D1631_13465 [Chryseobacterium nematophagum]
MKIIIISTLIILLNSCQDKKTFDKPINQNEVITMNQVTTDYDTLINRVRFKGNIDAYDELFYSFMDSNEAERTDSLMIYSKIMAEKFDYEKAYIDYITALCEKNNIKFDFSDFSTIHIALMDNVSKKLAEDWLTNMLEKKVITQQQYDSVKK